MAVLAVKEGIKIIELPAPVEISVGNEIIWASNTGRASTGKMIGDVIAEKETLQITWGIITAAEKNKIKKYLKTGFYPVVINIDGTEHEIQVYRGTLTSEALGKLDDGIYYFRSVSVDIVEQ